MSAEIAEVDERPHSRACGIRYHPHGPDCHPNCQTCHGVADAATRALGPEVQGDRWLCLECRTPWTPAGGRTIPSALLDPCLVCGPTIQRAGTPWTLERADTPGPDVEAVAMATFLRHLATVYEASPEAVERVTTSLELNVLVSLADALGDLASSASSVVGSPGWLARLAEALGSDR